jgi:hypothetical protein
MLLFRFYDITSQQKVEIRGDEWKNTQIENENELTAIQLNWCGNETVKQLLEKVSKLAAKPWC